MIVSNIARQRDRWSLTVDEVAPDQSALCDTPKVHRSTRSLNCVRQRDEVPDNGSSPHIFEVRNIRIGFLLSRKTTSRKLLALLVLAAYRLIGPSIMISRRVPRGQVIDFLVCPPKLGGLLIVFETKGRPRAMKPQSS